MINTNISIPEITIPNVDTTFVFNVETLVNIGYSIKKWSDCALLNNIDIKKQICRIVEIIVQAPTFDSSKVNENCQNALSFMHEITLIKNITPEYLSPTLKLCLDFYEVIQKNAFIFISNKLDSKSDQKTLIADHEVLLNQQILFQSLYCNQIIRKIAIAYINEKIVPLSLTQTNQKLFDELKAKVWKLVPPKGCLSTIENVESRFQKLLMLIEEMEIRIDLDNKGINPFYRENSCG